MTKRLLDSDTCVFVLRHRDGPAALRLRAASHAEVMLCSIVRAELLYGAFRSSQPQANLNILNRFFAGFANLPFDERCEHVYGRIRADLAQKGTPIGPNDLLIAAIALAHDAILVTHNTQEFSRVDGLRIEDWEVN